jgi:hypothetical protein
LGEKRDIAGELQISTLAEDAWNGARYEVIVL